MYNIHRVRPRVRVSHPTPSHGHKHSHSSPHPQPHSSPLSIPVRGGGRENEGTRQRGVGREGGESVMRPAREMAQRQSSRGAQAVQGRFPDILTLPSLVSTYTYMYMYMYR